MEDNLVFDSKEVIVCHTIQTNLLVIEIKRQRRIYLESICSKKLSVHFPLGIHGAVDIDELHEGVSRHPGLHLLYVNILRKYVFCT